jgi:hypothetical protein
MITKIERVIVMFGKNKNDIERFKVVDEQTMNMTGITVIQDIQTGVNYIMAQGINGFGITPLLDKDGKPMISDINKMND